MKKRYSLAQTLLSHRQPHLRLLLAENGRLDPGGAQGTGARSGTDADQKRRGPDPLRRPPLRRSGRPAHRGGGGGRHRERRPERPGAGRGDPRRGAAGNRERAGAGAEISSVDDALDRLARGETRPISVGEIESGGTRRRFILMAGAGFDGAVVRGVRLSEKRVIGKGAYLLSALREFLHWDDSELVVRGEDVTVSCHGVVVCNASRYGGEFLLAPEADLFAPGFEVVCIKGGRVAYLKLLLQLGLQLAPGGETLARFRAAEVELSGEKAVQLDGDYFCCTPLRIRSIPDLVRLVV